MSESQFVIPENAAESLFFLIFFFNDTATTEIYTLSLHDALPILSGRLFRTMALAGAASCPATLSGSRSEEHTSELQSQSNLVCRLLLEKKKEPRGPPPDAPTAPPPRPRTTSAGRI